MRKILANLPYFFESRNDFFYSIPRFLDNNTVHVMAGNVKEKEKEKRKC